MPHAIWKGSISFGLVTIPVTLYSAEERNDLSFRMLDGRDLTPVKQRRVNDRTGENVPWEEIVKGYELEPSKAGRKAAGGEIAQPPQPPAEGDDAEAEVVDITALLQASLEAARAKEA